jgi:hypothetical protein
MLAGRRPLALSLDRNRKRASKARSKRASPFYLCLSRRRRAGARFSLIPFPFPFLASWLAASPYFSWSQHQKGEQSSVKAQTPSLSLSLSRWRQAGARFSLVPFASLLAGGLSFLLLVVTAKGRAKLGQSARLFSLLLSWLPKRAQLSLAQNRKR